MLVFLIDDGGFEQHVDQELQSPGLEPLNLVNAVDCGHQATIPQFHHWPSQQEGYEQGAYD